jgi:hypothetical protein
VEWLEQQRMEARRDKVTAERHVAEAKAAQRAAVRAVAEAWVARCGRPHDQEGDRARACGSTIVWTLVSLRHDGPVRAYLPPASPSSCHVAARFSAIGSARA